MVKKDDVKIRRMTRSDIQALLILDRKMSEGRGVLSEGKVIGFIMTRLAYLMIPFIEVCIMQGIVVDPDYRGRGIGGKLLDGLLDHCQAEEINTIRAIVPQGNERLRLFIEAHGFRRSTIINYDKTFES